MAGNAPDSLRIVELPSEIDITNCDVVQARLLAAVSDPRLVIADMTNTKFCDSAGMRMLVAVDEHARANDCVVRFAVTSESSVARVTGILGIDSTLSVYHSVEEALPPRGATHP